MTPEQCTEKIAEIIRSQQYKDFLPNEIERLINSGGIELADYANDFVAPKLLLSLALHSLAEQYESHDPYVKKIAKNLRHF